MSISSLIWGQSQFDEAVDKATSELRLAEEDIALNLEICDQIRSKSVPAKDAVRALKRRLNHKNPNVQLLTLGLIDTCVKNGGDQFLNELASRESMDNMVSLLRTRDLNFDVKNKMLRLIQNWSIAFEGKYALAYVGQVYEGLKAEGFVFPPKDLTVANSAMIDTATAPEWIDSDVCLRCRTAFTFTNRKHHCRNCGGVFDQSCSSKSLSLPHFGINQEVRVCDGCHVKLTRASRHKEHSKSVDFLSSSAHRRQSSSFRKHRSERDLDADLQRAIELSLAEVGGPSKSTYNNWQASEPPLVDRISHPKRKGHVEEEDDPELRAAIEASLREANAPKPSAPIVNSYEDSEYSYRGVSSGIGDRISTNIAPIPAPLPRVPNNELDPRESDAIMTFNQTIQDAQVQGNPSLSRMPNIHELYDRANHVRPKLALSLEESGRKEQLLSEMHEKLSEAVKLYDHLLTQQISYPTWRSTSTSQQAYAPTYSQIPHRVSTNEWNNQPSTSAVEYHNGPTKYDTVSHPVSIPPVPSESRPVMHRQPSYGTNTAQIYTSPAMMQPPQQTSNPGWVSPAPVASAVPPQEHRHVEQYQSIHGAFSQVPAPAVTQPYTNVSSPPPVTPQSISSQIQGLSIQSPPPQTYAQPVHSPPPPAPSQQIQPYQQSPPVQAPAPVIRQTPAPVVHQPPIGVTTPVYSPPQQVFYQPSQPASLSRHNTVSHSPHVNPQATLARSNTVSSSSHTHTQNRFSAARSGPPPEIDLSAFPSVPKSEPAPFYGQSTGGLEQTEEKKEALLIDL